MDYLTEENVIRMRPQPGNLLVKRLTQDAKERPKVQPKQVERRFSLVLRVGDAVADFFKAGDIIYHAQLHESTMLRVDSDHEFHMLPALAVLGVYEPE